MSEVIVITSGRAELEDDHNRKCWNRSGTVKQKVVLIDTDIGLRNLDVVMGLENRIVYNLVDVVEGNCRVEQALIKDKKYRIYVFCRQHRPEINPRYLRSRCRH